MANIYDMNAAIEKPNVLQSFRQGQQYGEQLRQQQQAQRDEQQLRQLAPQVVGGDPQAYAQAAAIDPQAAGQYDTANVNMAKRAAGAAAYMLDAVKRGNPQEIQGRYQAVLPFLTKLGAAQGKTPPPQFDPAMVPAMEQLVAMSQGMGGGTSSNVQSTQIDNEGNIWTVDRSGRWTNSGIKASPSVQVVQQEGTTPYSVVTGRGPAGQVMPIGGPQTAPQGTPPPPSITTPQAGGLPPGAVYEPTGGAYAPVPPEEQRIVEAAAAAADRGEDFRFDVPETTPGYGPVRTPTAAEKAYATEAASTRAKLDLAPEVSAAAAAEKAATTEAEGIAKGGVEYLNDINERAAAAASSDQKLQQLEYALSRTYSGFGAEQLLNLRQIGAAFGVGNSENLAAGELARSISNKLALGLRNPAGGEGMPGAMSNADRDYLKASVPSLQTSPGGWRIMIQLQRQLNDYADRQSSEANRFLELGGKASQLRGHMQHWANENPIFKGLEAAPERGRTIQGEVGEIGASVPRGTQGVPTRIQNDDDYDQLPSGALFIAPGEARPRRKP